MYFDGDAAEEPPSKRRHEEVCAEQLAMQSRLTKSWPSDARAAQCDFTSMKVIKSLSLEHNRFHPMCGVESWQVCGFLGRRHRYALCVDFSSRMVVSDTCPTEEDRTPAYLRAVRWSIADHETHKYYRFSAVDSRIAVLLSTLIAQEEYVAEEHVLQATMEHLRRPEAATLPDTLLPPGSSLVRLNKLYWKLNENTLQQLPTNERSTAAAAPASSSQLHPHHLEGCILHLEGNTHEMSRDATEPVEEVRAVVDLVIRFGHRPFLDGDRGVLRPESHWDKEEFSYSYPHARLRSGSIRLTRVSDELELGRDLELRLSSMWVQHRFGGAVPRTRAEGAFMRVLRTQRNADALAHESTSSAGQFRSEFKLRLFTESLDTILLYHSSLPADGRNAHRSAGGPHHTSHDTSRSLNGTGHAESTPTCVTRAIVHHGKNHEACVWDNQQGSDSSTAVSVTVQVNTQYRSVDTGLVYPTEWTVHSPMYNDGSRMTLHLRATFAPQEFVSMLAQPGQWQGALQVSGQVYNAQNESTPVSGDGFGFYAHSTQQVQSMRNFFAALRRVTTQQMEQTAVPSAADLVTTKHDDDGDKGGRRHSGSRPLLLSASQRAGEAVVLSSVSTVSALARMQGLTLTDAHKLVLTALLATYRTIYFSCVAPSAQGHTMSHEDSMHTDGGPHRRNGSVGISHPGQNVGGCDDAMARRRVLSDALTWFHGQWTEFFGHGSVNYRTLILRAFMLRELGHVVRAATTARHDHTDPCDEGNDGSHRHPSPHHPRCMSSRSHSRTARELVLPVDCATALDVVQHDTHTTATADERQHFTPPPDEVDCIVPSDAMLSHRHDPVELAQLTALLDGVWELNTDRSLGNYDHYLLAQHVPLAWRNVVYLARSRLHFKFERVRAHARDSFGRKKAKDDGANNGNNSNADSNTDNSSGDDASHVTDKNSTNSVLTNVSGGSSDPVTDDYAESGRHICMTEETLLSEMWYDINLHGKKWQWTCPLRGPVTSRACVVTPGHQLFLQHTLPRGREYVWFTFNNDARTMMRYMYYYPSTLLRPNSRVDQQPYYIACACCYERASRTVKDGLNE